MIEKLSGISSAANLGELAERYDILAKDYDQIYEHCGYVVPHFAVATLVKHVPWEAQILDAGAGSGLAGELLREHGYTNLEALDMSKSMLDQARRKKSYVGFHHMVLGEPLDLPSASFDAVLSVGAFGPTHAPPHSFDELVRITRPGGKIVFSMSEDEMTENSAFKKKLDLLQQAGKWKLIERGEPFIGLPISKPGIHYGIWTCQRKRVRENLCR